MRRHVLAFWGELRGLQPEKARGAASECPSYDCNLLVNFKQNARPPRLKCTLPCPLAPAFNSDREDLRARFLGKPWLDVLSKADMLEEELDAAEELVAQQAQQGGDTAAEAAPAAAQEQQHAAVAGGDDGTSSSSGSSSSSESCAAPAAGAGAGAASATAPGLAVRTAVDFAAALPDALRVSSLTGDGIEALKGSMLSMLEEAQLAREGVEGWWGEGEAAGAGGGDELIFRDDEFHREHEAYMYD